MTSEEQKKIIAKNIRRYLELRHIQQKELAKAIGENPSTVNTWCTGKIEPPANKVQKMAEFFGCMMTDLVDEQSNKSITEQYDEITFKLGMTDEFFQRLAVKYYHLSPEEKETFKEFCERFIMKE